VATNAVSDHDISPGQTRAGALSPLLLLFGLSLVAVLVFWPTWAELAARWKVGGGYPHGWILVAAVIWIIWSRAPAWIRSAPRPAPLMAVFALAVSAGWLAAEISSTQLAGQIFALAGLAAVPIILFGWRGGLSLAATVALLGFGIPVWDSVGPILQQLTTDVTGLWLQASGVPVLIEGSLVSIPAGQFHIVEGCSGLNYFVAAGALAAVFGFLWLNRWQHRILLVSCALVLAVLANWLRVYTVILAGHLTDMRHFLVTVDHYWFGWVLFGVAMIPVYWLGARFEARECGKRHETAAGPSATGRQYFLAAAAGALALAAGPIAWWTVSAGEPDMPSPGALLPTVPGWQTIEGRVADWSPAFRKPDAVQVGRYSDGSREVDLGVVWYGRQEQGHELVFYGNHVADPGDWLIRRSPAVHRAGRDYRVSILVRSGGERRVAWWWYEVAGRDTASDLRAKVFQLAGFLEGRLDGAAVVVTATCTEDRCRDATEALENFVDALRRPVVAANLPVGEPEL